MGRDTSLSLAVGQTFARNGILGDILWRWHVAVPSKIILIFLVGHTQKPSQRINRSRIFLPAFPVDSKSAGFTWYVICK